ncbi:MAG TPA: hypothetical protein PKM84_00935 [Candidatus Pacearchaeota archaeon]|nr:hypothetical protein [Candidatus Pacearchaeota archaeon]
MGRYVNNSAESTGKARQVEILKIFEGEREAVEKDYNAWISNNPDFKITRIQSNTAGSSSSANSDVIGSAYAVFLFSIFVWYVQDENSPG